MRSLSGVQVIKTLLLAAAVVLLLATVPWPYQKELVSSNQTPIVPLALTPTAIITPVPVTTAPIPPPPIATTTTTQPVAKPAAKRAAVTPPKPKSFIEIAQGEVGKAGPYAETGFYCAKFVTWMAAQAKLPGWTYDAEIGPAELRRMTTDRGLETNTPVAGDIVYIALNGPGSHGQTTHVGIIESVNGNEIHTIEREPGSGKDVIIRNVRHVGDGYVVAFGKTA